MLQVSFAVQILRFDVANSFWKRCIKKEHVAREVLVLSNLDDLPNLDIPPLCLLELRLARLGVDSIVAACKILAHRRHEWQARIILISTYLGVTNLSLLITILICYIDAVRDAIVFFVVGPLALIIFKAIFDHTQGDDEGERHQQTWHAAANHWNQFEDEKDSEV